jgi:signal transduction histidine kinase
MIEKGIAIFFAGSLMTLVVHHVILFILYPRRTEYLYLSAICFCILLRTLTLSRNDIPLHYFLNTDFAFFKTIEFFCVYIMMAIFPIYVRSLFPSEFPSKIIGIFIAFGIVFGFLTLITPMNFFFSLLDVSHIVFIIEFCVAIYVLIKALLNRRPEAKVTLLGMAIAFPLILFEILANSEVIPYQVGSLLEFGVLIFLLSQTYILAKRNAQAYYFSELVNVGLEKAVNEKTAELMESNQLKNTLLSMISHDVKSPLNSIKSILGLLNTNNLEAQDIKPLTRQLEDQVQSTYLMVENILQWSSTQNAEIRIEKQLVLIKPLVDESLKLFAFQAQHKKIHLLNHIADNLYVQADVNVIKLVLRNLISNAIKFSNEGGRIFVNARPNQNLTYLTVSDNGIGIEPSMIRNLFNVDKRSSRLGTRQEIGTGIGLSLSKKFLNAMGSDIEVESSSKTGTRFTIDLETATVAVSENEHSKVA